MTVFGYSWLDDHLKAAGVARPALLARENRTVTDRASATKR